MNRSLFSKILTVLWGVVLVTSILIYLFSVKTIRQHYITTLSNNLVKIAYSLQPTIIPYLENRDYNHLNQMVKNFSKKLKVRITIFASNGKVLADSEESPSSIANHPKRTEVVEVFKGGFGKSIRYSTQKDMLYIALPLITKGKRIGIIRISFFLKNIDQLIATLKSKMALIVFFISLFALIGTFIFARNLTIPLKELTKASKRMADGDLSTRVNIERKDEIGLLAENFNEMGEKLENFFTQLSVKQEELNGIINSLEEPLIVFDKYNRAILFNHSLRKLVKFNPDGRFWWEIFDNPKMGELIERVKKEGKISSEEILFGNKNYLCSLVLVAFRQEVIAVLHDITKFKQLEKIKKDFIVNVSHELRTPLTAIKGYVETLEEEIKGDSLNYLEIIKRHTERVINIVNDLLTLSELENKGLVHFEEVNILEIARNVFKLFDQKAKEKNLKLNIYGSEPVTIRGDSFKLEQMFINLVDNAIKYTEHGEINIYIRRKKTDVIIKIKDTGIGIPQRDIDRIFERFYVVNKSRSRTLGGTGLGLSIVKHIVLLHKGKIEVRSSQGKGTEFLITLPITQES